MQKILLLALFLISGTSLKAQHDIFINGSLLGGIPFNSFDADRKILHSRLISSSAGASISAEYRIWKLIGLEGGLIQNKHSLKMGDKKFGDRNDGFALKLKSKENYWSYFSSVNLNIGLDDETQFYTKLGYCFHNVGGGELTEIKKFIVSDENVHVSTKYENKSRSVFLEAGIQKELSDNAVFFIGLRFNKGLSAIGKGEYFSELHGQKLIEDKFTTTGTFLAANMGLKVNVFHKNKRTKTPKPAPVVTPNPVPQKQPGQKLDKKVDGRPLVVNQVIQVGSRNVKIYVWDDQKVDGDLVSINLNGMWILQNYSLQKKQQLISVYLNEGENYLVLHALNLGQIPPNTAVLMVDDGIKQQTIHLESDLKNSGTLIINYKQ